MPLFGTTGTGRMDELLLFLVLAGGVGGVGRIGIEELLLFTLLSADIGRTGIDELLLFILLSGMTGIGRC